MNLWQQLRDAVASRLGAASPQEAMIDLDVLLNHDELSKHFIATDLNRLERRNRDRRQSPHHAFGELVTENGELRWTPHRIEKTCGVANIEFKRDQLRTLQQTEGAVVAVLRDGTNVAFVVNKRKKAVRKPTPKMRARHQEPPLIS